ncbi:hypothetical protein GCM10007919_51560 [Rhizobium indigoferae]|nr:hypothetical protein GCM10007919_51560 [Rhizobium indigoferae]
MCSDVKCVGLDFGDRIVPPPNTHQLIEAAAIANFVAVVEVRYHVNRASIKMWDLAV